MVASLACSNPVRGKVNFEGAEKCFNLSILYSVIVGGLSHPLTADQPRPLPLVTIT